VSMQLPQVTVDKTLVCRLVEEVDGYQANRPLLLDGADSPAWTETSGLSALARRRTAPTVVVCDETRKPRSRTCDTVVLRRPSVALLCGHLKTLFPDVPADTLQTIVDRARCDIRHIFANVESFLGGKACWGGRDEFLDGTESITQLFSESADGNVEHACRLAGIGDSHALVHENYLDAKSNDIHRISRAADWMSLGDVIEHSLYVRQAWQLYDFRLFAGSVAPAFCVGPLKSDVRASTQRGHQSRKRSVLTKKNNDKHKSNEPCPITA
jgi:hypothetical protein